MLGKHAHTDARTDSMNTVNHPQTKFVGGIKTKFAGGIIMYFLGNASS